jgi:hypothetical protein
LERVSDGLAVGSELPGDAKVPGSRDTETAKSFRQ